MKEKSFAQELAALINRHGIDAPKRYAERVDISTRNFR